jgi:ribosomal protein S18 acetylase RimI-like enzyme
MAHLRRISPDHPAAAPLLAGLRQHYHRVYGPAVAAELDRYSPIEFVPPAGAFVIVEDDGMTVAGGALRRLGVGYGEIKRMWTAPDHRGRGYARRVLRALEAAAARAGYHTLRLETGDLQEEAIGLYESSGYSRIPGYGEWRDHPQCVTFEKRLADRRDHLRAEHFDRVQVFVRQMLQHHA